MVDFRYHLVSIIAVFLALTVGLVLGSAVLNDEVLENLQGQVDRITEDNRDLRAEVREQQGQADADAAFADSALPTLVGGRLSGVEVVVVSAPTTPGALQEDAVSALRAAGAEVTAQVQVRDRFVDPSSKAVVEALVSRLVPAGLQLPTTDDYRQRAAAELAAVLVARPGTSGFPASATASVLAGFREADLVVTSGAEPRSGQLAVVLTGPPPESRDAVEPTSAAMLGLARALDLRGGGTVLAGPRPAAGPEGGLLSDLRRDSGLATVVSGVDGVDQPQGQAALVYALLAERRGQAQQYEGGALPLPSPSP